MELFSLSMTSEIESFKGYWYTPLDENEQKWERKLEWRLLPRQDMLKVSLLVIYRVIKQKSTVYYVSTSGEHAYLYFGD